MFGLALQLGDVELPSDVEALPVDYLAWLLLMVGVFVLLHLYTRWVLQRNPAPLMPQAEPLSEASSLLEDLQALQDALPNLSQTQLQEALTLSSLLRRACGSSWSAKRLQMRAMPSVTSFISPLAFCSPDAWPPRNGGQPYWRARKFG